MKKINKTLKAAKVSRRSVLKGAAATGAAAAIGPWYIPNAFAAPVVNVLMWGEYLPDSVVADFKAKTGITVNHTKIGDNGEIISKMKAGGGAGYDLASPTNMRALQWENLGVLAPFDMNRINTSAVNPGMLAVGERDWNLVEMDLIGFHNCGEQSQFLGEPINGHQMVFQVLEIYGSLIQVLMEPS